MEGKIQETSGGAGTCAKFCQKSASLFFFTRRRWRKQYVRVVKLWRWWHKLVNQAVQFPKANLELKEDYLHFIGHQSPLQGPFVRRVFFFSSLSHSLSLLPLPPRTSCVGIRNGNREALRTAAAAPNKAFNEAFPTAGKAVTFPSQTSWSHVNSSSAVWKIGQSCCSSV